MIRNSILLMLAAVSLLSACKKEERTKEELLLGTHWRRTADQRVVVTAGGPPVATNTTINCSGNDCSCDDYIVFTPDHQLENNTNGTTCASQLTTRSGKWCVDQKDQTLIAWALTGYNGYWAFTIEELSSSTLKVSHQIVTGTTVSTFRTTFTAQ
jgi:hypothetical protein